MCNEVVSQFKSPFSVKTISLRNKQSRNTMKRTLLYAALAAFSLAAPAYAQEAPDAAATAKIREEGLKHSNVMETAFLLTDVTGPRLSGSPGLRKAQQLVAAELKKMGFSNVNVEPWDTKVTPTFGKGWQIDKNYVALAAPYYDALIAYPKAWSGSTNGLIKGEVVVVKIDTVTDLDKYKGKLAGKIVITDVANTQAYGNKFNADGSRQTDERLAQMAAIQPTPAGGPAAQGRNAFGGGRNMAALMALRQQIPAFYAAEKVGLVINLARGTDGTMFTSNGNSRAADAPAAGAELEMSAEDYLRLLRLAKSGRKVEVEADIKTSFYTNDMNEYNVIAEIPGSDPKLKSEIVMLGGHFDSWHSGTGATDNAAGCAVMIEALRILKATGLQPKRTIRLALWSGEEQGLIGSRNYVGSHFANTADMKLKPEHEKLSAYYNLDNGTGKIRGIYLQGNAAAGPVFAPWLVPFKDLGATTVTISNTGGTDHQSFDAVGLPGFQFIQDGMDYNTRTHHSNQDTYDRLSADDLMQAATIVASFAYNTAQRAEKIPRKELPAARPPVTAPATTAPAARSTGGR